MIASLPRHGFARRREAFPLVRFIFVDRVIELLVGKSILTVKSVATSEDYFADHFPGMPIMPGALILECMIQSAMLMLGATSDFRSQPIVKRIRRAAFKHVVRPGDRLAVRCAADDRWMVHATAAVDDRTVATAIIEFECGPALPASNPLRSLHEALRMDPDELAARVGAA